ncbi:MAG: sulfatase [Myxococcota bacterium]
MDRWLLRLSMCAALLAVGCDDETSGEGGDASASPEVATHLSLLRTAHLADVHHHGLYVDFGTPAQAKYTVGDWESGWGGRGNDGDVTYANVGRRARIYFDADAPAALVVRLQLRPRGTGVLTPYINGQALEAARFEGEGWTEVDFTLPAEHVRRGENALQIIFGGVTSLGGEDVSVQLASMRVSTEALGGDLRAPEWGTTVAGVALGEERPSLAFATPIAFRFHAEVPRDGRLQFGAGQEGQAGGTGRVVVTPEGGAPTTVWEGSLGSTWSDQDLDLTRFAGQVVRLTLEAEGGSGRAAFSRPRLVTPPYAPTAREPAKNVVVLLVDTLRASKVRPYNPDSRVRTPRLDALAEESVVFERAQSTENWTKPAVGAILTGLHPLDHGARTQAAVLSSSALMLSEQFKQNGFATGGFIANGYISDRFGFDQGWDRYKNFIREAGASSEARDVFQEAGDWALEHRDERFFLYVHTIDPHVPYDPEEEFVSMYDARTDYDGQVRPRMTGDLLAGAKSNPPSITFTRSDVRRLQALHDGEITQHDVHMGTFIDRLKEAGLWEDTIFVFVSDHGEEFNEHGSWGHGHSVYQELLHVPFLIHGAGDARRVPETVSTMDIAPTVLELAGVPPMPSIAGRSLVPLIDGGRLPGPTVAMSEFLDERRVIVAGRWKFLVRGNLTASMFDLQEDPEEKNQLGVNAHPIATRYLRTLQGQFLGASDRSRWLDSEQGRGQQHEAGEVQMDSELQEQLRQLGYL